MELTGNLYERCITVGNPEGRASNGSHGNGRLLFNGSHNVASWPAGNTDFGYSGSRCNRISQSATPATRDYFLSKGNQRKKRRTKFRPLRKNLSQSHPSPAGIRFGG
jgi:hypothetical protein